MIADQRPGVKLIGVIQKERNMGIRGEIFSTKVALLNRTYFFNVKENRMGDLYLNIVESKNRDSGGFDRQSVILFADDLQEFLQGFDESLRVLEKAVREKRRGKKTESSRAERSEEEPASGVRQSGHEYGAKNSNSLRRPKFREGRGNGKERRAGKREGGGEGKKAKRLVVKKKTGD
jgi:hypothetical protein